MSHDGGMWVIVERSGRFWVVVHGKEKWKKENEVRYLTKRGHDTKGHASSTKEDPETQHREGRCFTCNKQGHLARNCLDKPAKTSDKGKVKARTAETEPIDSEDEAEPQTIEEKAKAVIQLGRSMKEEEKIDFLMRVIEADKGAEGEDMDF